MPMDLQLILLRVLQEKEVIRLGSNKKLPIDVRIIAATNKPIETMMSGGLFRSDLFYRLSLIVLQLPPLRERKRDIKRLAEYFLHANRKKYGHNIKGIDRDTLAIMEEYDWPGNVRELENVIERAIIFSSGSSLTVDNLIPKEHKPTHDRYRLKSENTGLSLKSGEKFLIQRALQEADGNITKAAKTLGITRATMYRKIKAYGI
jgi:transcriptional regulator with PAS, ATPase and Fis domain